jgi:diaminopimelate decarboxylase
MRGGQIGLHGNNKSDAELKLALENDFHAVFIDSLDEIVRVEDIAKALDKTANIILRLTTGVHAGGHEFISTAHEDQKFGLSVSSTSGADSVALQAVEQVLACEHLKLQGVHSHIGSQIASPDGFLASAEKLLEFRLHVKSRFGVLLETLDLGGGFGIQYLDTDPELDLTQLFESLQGLISEHSKANQLPLPSLVFEPGRWVIGPCMFMVYTVGTIKDVEYSAGMFRRYVSVDGGMADNIRPMLYGAKYSCYALTFEPSDDTTACRVVGKHCESGDILIDDVQLPKSLKRNDLLVIPSVGAYSYSMSSNYNMLPKPAVIALENGRVREMIKRQDESEIIR